MCFDRNGQSNELCVAVPLLLNDWSLAHSFLIKTIIRKSFVLRCHRCLTRGFAFCGVLATYVWNNRAQTTHTYIA